MIPVLESDQGLSADIRGHHRGLLRPGASGNRASASLRQRVLGIVQRDAEYVHAVLRIDEIEQKEQLIA